MRTGSYTILLAVALLLSGISVHAAGVADVKSYIAKGDACAEKDDYAQAFDYFSKAIELDPKCARAYFRIGAVYFAKTTIDLSQNNRSSAIGYCELALKQFNTAISLNPKYNTAYEFRGLCYSILNKLDLAVADYSKAIKINPNDASLYMHRGNAYTEKQQPDAALRDYQTCAKLDPKCGMVYPKLGAAYADKGMHERAIAAYDKASQQQPTSTYIYYMKGMSYMELGRKKEALASFQKFVSKYPNCTPEYTEKFAKYCDKAFLCIDMLKKQLAEPASK